MSDARTQLLIPPAGQMAGRLVMGSVYDPQTKDMQGNPLTVKTGPNKGQPTQKFFFALAVKKGAEGHWAHTDWGKVIWAIGHAAFPQQAQAPSFAWKVSDGDSVTPNKNGRKNSETEGFPGHWVLMFSSTYPPKVVNTQGQTINEPGAVKIGYYAQVLGSCSGNGNTTNPGVYLNGDAVIFVAYGAEIRTGVDLSKIAGLGQVSLPPGASAAPLGGTAPAAPLPGAAPAPAAAPPPPAAFAAPAAPAPAPTAVAPAPAFTAAPPPPGAAGVAPPPPAASGPQMTPKAAGKSYAQFVAAGWNDAQLRAEGYLV